MSLLLGAKITSATGGTISTITGYTVHIFTSSGTFTPNGSGPVEVLVVGGGGGGQSNDVGGGGGGGSVLYQKYIPVLSGVAYTMTVGALGGAGTRGGITTCRYNGGTITAPGGAGAASPIPARNNPLGSGGGAPASGGAAGGIGANVIGLGFNGGGSIGPAASGAGGGGGGAGGLGQPALAPSTGGQGGIGVSYSISGVSTFYGGGGGGGGNNAYGSTNPASSLDNFGYGSSGRSPQVVGAAPGVIIIRYPS
jgi:hypothetical protein